MLFNELKKGVLLSSVFISLLGLQIPSLYAQSMGDVTFKKQSWVVLPGETRNLSVIDGTLFCYSGGLMLTAPVSSGTIVALMGDTAYSPIDGKMDYVVKHPVSGNIFYTRVDSRGHHTCYEVMPREGKRPKASKIKMNRGISVNHPVFSADGRIMVFSSDQGEGRGGYDLYYSTRNADGEWGAPRNLGSNINTQGDECAPTIYGGFLYYTSRENRTNAPWILRAVRLYHLPVEGKVELGRNMSFDLPSPFNSLADNIEIAFDTVKGRIYLLTNRDGDMGLYLYEGRLPLTVAYGHISAPDGKRMSGVDVSLFAGEKLVGRTISDEEGRYRFLLNRETDYSLWVSRPGYFGNSVEIKATDEDELYAVLEQVFDVSLDRLELNTKQYIYDVFGPDASIELSARGKQKLMRIVRFLYENPHIKLNIGVISSASENEGLNNIVNARRIETLHQYLSQLLTHASINIYDARNEAVGRVRNAFNACLTVRLEE